ncbi:unnamed protein product [Alopecurus aequalis]
MAAAAVDPMVLGLGTSGGASSSVVVAGGVGRSGGGAVMEGAQPVDLIRHPSGIVPVLQNIVSTVNLDCRLDLKQIALQARNAEYNPKRFAAVIMRIRDPKTTALIFASGKMVCTGAKSEEHSKLAARKRSMHGLSKSLASQPHSRISRSRILLPRVMSNSLSVLRASLIPMVLSQVMSRSSFLG